MLEIYKLFYNLNYKRDLLKPCIILFRKESNVFSF
jgi:hypothetical protein